MESLPVVAATSAREAALEEAAEKLLAGVEGLPVVVVALAREAQQKLPTSTQTVPRAVTAAGAKAGYGVYHGPGNARNVSAPLTKGAQTSQRAEPAGVNHALKQTSSSGGGKNVHVHTDSQYARGAVTGPSGNRVAGNVANRDLVQSGRAHVQNIQTQGGSVTVSHVPGHSGSTGNAMAHQLAQAGASRPH